MGPYILSMNCIRGDDLQIAIHRREDIFRWLKTVDHEGSLWSVVFHNGDSESGFITTDITDEIIEEYRV